MGVRRWGRAGPGRAGAFRLSPPPEGWVYWIGMGANRAGMAGWCPGHGLVAGLEALRGCGVVIERVAGIIETEPLGPSCRRYVNRLVRIRSCLSPPALLDLLKRIERQAGRRRGRRWGARPLDLDIIAWSGGGWRTRSLVIPHRGLAGRAFVLRPLLELDPCWRHPETGFSVRQLAARLDHPRPRA